MKGLATFLLVCFLCYFPVHYGRSTPGVLALVALVLLFLATLPVGEER